MPYLLLLLTSFLFGGNFVLGKSLVGHASPMTLTSLRWIIGVLTLLPIVWWKEKKLYPPKEAILPLILMGATGVFIFNLLQFFALEKTSATNVGLISTLNTISIAVCSFLFLKEKINILQMGSMFLSFSGVLLVLTKGNLFSLLSFQFNIGDLYMIGAVCIWGIYSICSKWAMSYDVSPLMSTLYSGLFGIMLMFPFNFADFEIIDVNRKFIQSILYLGIVSTVVCMVLWNIGVQKLGATTSGVFLNFNPIFTAVLAFLFLGEKMTWIQGVGSAVVIAGCYLFTYFHKRQIKVNSNPNPQNL
ncbi:DMT family transporter [Niallia nealsonii]|uniref:EamA family transporter n=1 Tax=Niallia nealsonii TaxID=115979 RepID=A0A2N0YYG0_9BACI|nr:DMT family transporter [Niallia nealsonii]PKG22294.1 EamA family transporter [Niallia nealsonii]